MQYRNAFFNAVLRPAFRTSSVLCPSLHEMSTFGPTSIDAYEILAKVFDFKNRDCVIESYLSEFEALKEKLRLRLLETKLNYPLTYSVSDATATLLYLLVRVFDPNTVLETGVANGVSSYYILNALNKNNKGTLFSVDINSNVGELLDEQDKSRWQLKIVNEERAGSEFGKIVGILPNVDIFVHDSDHSYKAQMREYKTAYGRISNGGILASDDVDFSYAFLDFCSSIRGKPYFLVTPTKAFGLLRKNVHEKS